MKKVVCLCCFIVMCICASAQQIWINIDWNKKHCDDCLWMQSTLHLPMGKAARYHDIIHDYGRRIAREIERGYHDWDRVALRIYKLRMERDRQLQRLLSPDEFRMFLRFSREFPLRIHDCRGWFNYSGDPHYKPSLDCRRYEDNYWHHEWIYGNGCWKGRFDNGKWYPGKYDKPYYQGNDRPHYRRHDDMDRYYEKDNRHPNGNGYGRGHHKGRRGR